MTALLTGSTKGALDMLTKMMALELGPHKVHRLEQLLQITPSAQGPSHVVYLAGLSADPCECSKPHSSDDTHGPDQLE